MCMQNLKKIIWYVFSENIIQVENMFCKVFFPVEERLVTVCSQASVEK